MLNRQACPLRWISEEIYSSACLSQSRWNRLSSARQQLESPSVIVRLTVILTLSLEWETRTIFQKLERRSLLAFALPSQGGIYTWTKVNTAEVNVNVGELPLTDNLWLSFVCPRLTYSPRQSNNGCCSGKYTINKQ